MAGLSGFGIALLTHFTAPSTTILAGVLVGVLVAGSPRGHSGRQLGAQVRDWLDTAAARSAGGGIRTVRLVGWSAGRSGWSC